MAGSPNVLSVPPIDVVCILHGGCAVPAWLLDVAQDWRLHLTLNDADDHEYHDVPPTAIVTRNAFPLGFAKNVNTRLRRIFVDDGREMACVVNFDLEAHPESLRRLVSALAADQSLGAAGAVLCSVPGTPTFSIGTVPTPAREALRASGLRTERLVRLQRRVLKRTSGWVARNEGLPSGTKVLNQGEYLPWTCLAVRSTAYAAVGGLDERFPLYAEDIDWSLRCHQSPWRLALVDSGPVVHAERATRGPRTDALYEFSHLELHRKWQWDANLRWQRRALRVRRSWPVRRLTDPFDWTVVTNLDESACVADGDATGGGTVTPTTIPYVSEPGRRPR